MKRRVIAAAIIAAVIVIAALFHALSSGSESYTLYYFNSDCTALNRETRRIRSRDDDKLSGVIIDALKKSPSVPDSRRLIDKNVSVLSLVQDDEGRLSVDFSADFLDSPNSLLAAYGVVKSLSGAGSVRSVRILIEGSELADYSGRALGYMDDSGIISEYGENDHEFILPLYFERGGKLVKTEQRVPSRNGGYEYLIVKNLISADSRGALSPLLNPETELLDVRVSGGFCYVNFGADFFKDNPDGNELLIYSVVNSLTESEDIDKVVFLFGGKRGGSLGGISLDGVFGRNERIIDKN